MPAPLSIACSRSSQRANGFCKNQEEVRRLHPNLPDAAPRSDSLPHHHCAGSFGSVADCIFLLALGGVKGEPFSAQAFWRNAIDQIAETAEEFINILFLLHRRRVQGRNVAVNALVVSPIALDRILYPLHALLPIVAPVGFCHYMDHTTKTTGTKQAIVSFSLTIYLVNCRATGRIGFLLRYAEIG